MKMKWFARKSKEEKGERERLQRFEFLSKKDVTSHVNSNHRCTTRERKNLNYQP
jgi:hypothetical protein